MRDRDSSIASVALSAARGPLGVRCASQLRRRDVLASCLLSVLVLVATPSSANVAPGPQVCADNDFWGACAKKVKQALAETSDPRRALELGAEWDKRYLALYLNNPQRTWTMSDQERLEKGMEDAWDDTVGQYLDPAGLALGLALKRYFKRLVATVETLTGPRATGFYMLLAPSPIANDFTAARTDNGEIHRLVMSKLPRPTQATIRERFPELFRKGYARARNGATLP